MKRIFILFLALISFKGFCANGWDLRSIANASNNTINLTRQDGSVYFKMPTSQAKALVEITDKFSVLSGIYPKIYLQESDQINAFATMRHGSPVILINKPMFELIKVDIGVAAALIGHEMAHLYFQHGEKNSQSQKEADAASAIIGTLLEMFFIGRYGVIGVGSDIGNAMGSAIQASFSRDQEREADKQGLIWAIQAGFDPNGAGRLFSIFEREKGSSLISFMNSHPNPSERIQNANNISELYEKYKNTEVLVSPELLALNKLIDEDRKRQLPKSEEGIKGVTAFSSKDYAAARLNFEICSDNKEVACLNNLGVLYHYGLGVPVDIKKAIDFYKRASDLGSGLALFNFVRASTLIPNRRADVFEILKLQKEAIDRGSANAMGTLAAARSLSDNSLLPQEWKEKLQVNIPKESLLNYAKAAAMRGAKEGKLALGIYYLYGIGVQKNIALAESFLNQAINEGEFRAVGGLHYLYDIELKDSAKLDFIKSKFFNSQNKALPNLITALYYCTETATEEMQKKCFQFIDQAKYFSTGSSLYGYLKLVGAGTTKDEIEGNAWLMYSINKMGLDFSTWLYTKNLPKLSRSDISKIEDRARQIALEQ